MRIEVIVDNEEPKIYPLNKPKIVLGSHESCDIILPSKNVSRKHLVISTKDDQFFVSDQGSTNGSFINEQRLVPGSSVEFTSFFPVRLGTDVLVSLLSDEEAQELGFDSDLNSFAEATSSAPIPKDEPVREESTKMISLKDLNKSSTAGLVQKRATTVAKRKTAVKAAPVVKKKKKDQKNLYVGIAAVVFIGIAAYYNKMIKKEQEGQTIQAIEAQKPKVPAMVFEGPVKRIEETELPQADVFLAAFKEKRCLKESEKILCAALPDVYQGKWGVVQSDKLLIILADGDKYEQAAKLYVKPPVATDGEVTESAKRYYRSDLNLVMMALWVRDNIPADLADLSQVKDFNIAVAFIRTEKVEESDVIVEATPPPEIVDGTMAPENLEATPAPEKVVTKTKEVDKLVAAGVFVPESLLRLRATIKDKDFETAKSDGAASFSYVPDFLRFL